MLEATLHAFVKGAEKAVRLRGEGRSTASAPLPAWVVECAAFEFQPIVENEPSSFVFAVEDAPLVQRAAQFAQGDLFAGDLGEKSGMDLFEDGLEAALLGNMDSELFDDGLLASFVALGQGFKWGVERVEIVNGRTVALTKENLMRVEALTRRTARPQHVRVAGKQVVVEGTAHFHPSGKAQRIEATRLALAGDIDLKLFAERPKALFEGPVTSLRPAGDDSRKNWFDAVWGKWPGEETADELVQLIREFS